ncbi:class I SAM-dependent methyltransferase [Niameybacter massiliensis]|uniref:Class I SAM-dependent methyltransferase n=1 Tax=Holtiella tumoricola TaxID=3018743 RepID=A0AA42J428_9FIRM|nr:class I SAM-dependent methyltransferase [Holtiella tumoricola]MDA3734026.1 class I SAM-dependent methyltransferase [Holtiella tumoricola]
MSETLNYYNTNAKDFIAGTLNVDMSELRNKFLSYLPQAAHILDAGCGSGRDSLAFKDAGYRVTAIDGSEAMCNQTAALIGQPVRQMIFQEIEDVGLYDGIWACATLLHVPEEDMVDVFRCLSRALKNEGILYASFKYGDFEGERNGRYFSDYTEERFAKLLAHFPELVLVEQGITVDKRPDREEKWLNVIVRKTFSK